MVVFEEYLIGQTTKEPVKQIVGREGMRGVGRYEWENFVVVVVFVFEQYQGFARCFLGDFFVSLTVHDVVAVVVGYTMYGIDQEKEWVRRESRGRL